jgi:hypothetical protein
MFDDLATTIMWVSDEPLQLQEADLTLLAPHMADILRKLQLKQVSESDRGSQSVSDQGATAFEASCRNIHAGGGSTASKLLLALERMIPVAPLFNHQPGCILLLTIICQGLGSWLSNILAAL